MNYYSIVYSIELIPWFTLPLMQLKIISFFGGKVEKHCWTDIEHVVN